MVALHPVTVAYNEFLGEMDGQPYSSAITALWALERVYLDGWTWASPGAAAFRPFVEHWTLPAFTTYVDGLATATDAALATESDTTAVGEAFAQVADLERRFWDVAWSVR
jgi:thiaminase/transcriptional activator TenA